MNPRTKRRVTFRASSKVHEIPQTKEEVAWISHKELVEYRKDMLRSFRHAKKYGFEDDESFCLRGMESLLNNGLSAGRRRLARRAVLQAQDMKDPEFLARIYKNYCNSSLEAARTKAEKDQQEALPLDHPNTKEMTPPLHQVSGRAA
mmetsp:Transcript_91039/g.136386  ORF Transcript_91039/g.136386 Transcript_91039/m.136386 type:complete len:147 (-) Transcript_91039:152-592(-)|eukprot:CAMPEP_0117026630 /NCGR_PEP_ID=MMETSP0472-20121206/19561_1 /TAXON_ID=693140 ORGANISM="Tiarina fusus, Strain LIS" /NCGR_SAMPLE_ID=MMETSP0472 /ASSEMBLY_ACC=CAM_ASM_000603 /LENGTH=146 /DNA_ID=CAMNT_0004733693 /DNA_START=148 /DNA_END=588 /DNA_ORIENTATION=-